MNPNQNNIDNLTNNSISWLTQVFSFGNAYSSLLVWGVFAVMVSKLVKFKVNLGGQK
jgi:hypothetical protein